MILFGLIIVRELNNKARNLLASAQEQPTLLNAAKQNNKPPGSMMGSMNMPPFKSFRNRLNIER
jgi:choline dehydrogenase-like flavoprotein